MKKIISVLCVVLMLFSLCSCNAGGNIISVNGTTVLDKQIFTYFLDEIYNSSEGITRDACISSATSAVLQYIAVNTRFKELGKSLTPNQKAAVSREVNALWRYYGTYYAELGISKDTFFKIKQYECAKRELCLALYDKDGTNPINEEYIKQYFAANYAGIKYFYEELYPLMTQSEYDALSESDKKAYDASRSNAQNRYNSNSEIANYVNSGVYTMDEAFMAITGQVSADISVSVDVLSRTDSAFSAEFVEAVFKQSVGSAFIITNPEKSYMYFVERVDILDDKYELYEQHREECLLEVAESFFVNEINTWISSYNTVRNLSMAKQCYNKVVNIDKSKYAGADNYIFEGFKEEK